MPNPILPFAHVFAAAQLAVSPLGGPSPVPIQQHIEWRADFDETLAQAGEQERIVFIAVNIGQGEADKRMAKDVYTDERIVELSASTLNVVAAMRSHGDGDTCKTYPGISCDAHRKIEKKVRSRILKSNEAGEVVSPQSIFLGPGGEVILSVPYEVSVAELEWCFLSALSEVDPDKFAPEKSETAERPEMVFVGKVAAPGEKPEARPSKEETEKIIAKLEEGQKPERALALLSRLATSAEPSALRCVTEALNKYANDPKRKDDRLKLLRRVAEVGVLDYWKDIVEMLDDKNDAFVHEAIVALEQLAVPESNSVLLKRLKRAKDETLKKHLVRAVATTAHGDTKAQREILKASTDRKSPLVRANALVALGDFVVGSRSGKPEAGEIDEKIIERLYVALWPEEHGKRGKTRVKEVTPSERIAALVAMATIGDLDRFGEVLDGVLTDSDVPQEVRDAAARTRKIMAGEVSRVELATMRREAAEDRIPRKRAGR